MEESGREEPVERDAMAADIEELEREIETLRKSVEETQSSYLRVLADFDNFRKRQREENLSPDQLRARGIDPQAASDHR